jgi:hypothetical protein
MKLRVTVFTVLYMRGTLVKDHLLLVEQTNTNSLTYIDATQLNISEL